MTHFDFMRKRTLRMHNLEKLFDARRIRLYEYASTRNVSYKFPLQMSLYACIYSFNKNIICTVHNMQVRYCRLFAYIIEIHPLIYDACTNCKKSDHSYVFALNVPYCTCQSPNLTQKRFGYLIAYCYVLCSTFPNTCLHY